MFKNYSILILSIISLIILALIITFLSKSNIGSFQKIILMLAIVVLFITLIIIAYALKQSKNANWPPIVPDCPDYWVSDLSGNNIICKNVKNLGTCKPPRGMSNLVMNFNTHPYTGSNGNCAKYTWANNCNIAWDGLTYGVSNPCAT